MLYTVEWLALYNKYLLCGLVIHTIFTFVTFLFLDVYLNLKTNINQKDTLILITLLKLTETISVGSMLLSFLLLVTLSVLIFIQHILIALLYFESLNLLFLNLQIISLKFFVKTWIWVFIYTKVYKLFIRVFFEFKWPLEKFGNFLLKFFPTISIFIVFISLNLIIFLIINPNYVIYL